MSVKIVQSGRELEIRSAFEYLERAYNIPAGHIHRVTVDGKVGHPMSITVSVYVQAEDPDDSATRWRSTGAVYVYPEGHGWEVCRARPCPLHPDETAAKPREQECRGCRESYWPDPKGREHAHASGHPEMRNR